MADIFVSYKREDRAIAERVVAGLEGAGHSVWWDDAITPAEAWTATLEREIALARAVLVLWTKRSVTSQWVLTEVDYALQHGKLLHARFEDC